METELTAIGTRYVFRRSRTRKLELYFLARTKSPIDKKTSEPPAPDRWMGTERKGERIRNFAEVRRKCMNAPRESGSTCRYFHVDRVTGGRSSLVAFENFGRSEERARSGFFRVRNVDESTNERTANDERRMTNQRTDERMNERASEKLALVRREVGDSRRKNFNLGIFKINEPRETRVRQITCSLSQGFCTRVL